MVERIVSWVVSGCKGYSFSQGPSTAVLVSYLFGSILISLDIIDSRLV